MSPESQRIAIAESFGWRRDGILGWWRRGDDAANTTLILHDYLGDLNAMHEVEASQNWSAEQYAEYVKRIEDTMPKVSLFPLQPDPKYQKGDLYADVFELIHATAAQRAEAYLRTVGKWKDATK